MKKDFATILSPVWGIRMEETAPLIAAAKSGEQTQIEAAIASLEKMLADNPQENFPYHAKYRGFETEIRAKIAVLNAIINNDWQAAYAAYLELGKAMDSLAASCGGYEDVACMAFKCDASNARHLAQLCLKNQK